MEYTLFKLMRTTLLVVLIYVFNSGVAQAVTSISGQITLPPGVTASEDYFPSVSVQAFDENGFFVNSFFTSSIIPQGGTTVSYRVDGIDDGPTVSQYRVFVQCFGCGNTVPSAALNLDGSLNVLDSFFNSSFIPKANLPTMVNFNLISGVTVSGQVILPVPNNTGRALSFAIFLRDLEQFTSSNSAFVTIEPGATSAPYSITGVVPSDGRAFLLGYNCGNCELDFVNRVNDLQSLAISRTDLSDVDVLVSNEGTIVSGTVTVPRSFDLTNEFSGGFVDILNPDAGFIESVFFGSSEISTDREYEYQFFFQDQSESLRVGYFCFVCDGLLNSGFFKADEPIYRAVPFFNEADNLRPDIDHTNIDFSMIADANGDGIPDPRAGNVGAAILLLLDDEQED